MPMVSLMALMGINIVFASGNFCDDSLNREKEDCSVYIREPVPVGRCMVSFVSLGKLALDLLGYDRVGGS